MHDIESLLGGRVTFYILGGEGEGETRGLAPLPPILFDWSQGIEEAHYICIVQVNYFPPTQKDLDTRS